MIPKAGEDWICPNCSVSRALTPVDVSKDSLFLSIRYAEVKGLALQAESVNCKSCKYYQVGIRFGISQQYPLPPPAVAQQFPISGEPFLERQLYPNTGNARPRDPAVPAEIYKDYEEAWMVLDYSTRAAAMLARRALQQILIDKYGTSKGSFLKKSLEEARSKIDSRLYDALLTVKWGGDSAAHDPFDLFEADRADVEKFLTAIDYFIVDTYVTPARRSAALDEIANLRTSR